MCHHLASNMVLLVQFYSLLIIAERQLALHSFKKAITLSFNLKKTQKQCDHRAEQYVNQCGPHSIRNIYLMCGISATSVRTCADHIINITVIGENYFPHLCVDHVPTLYSHMCGTHFKRTCFKLNPLLVLFK